MSMCVCVQESESTNFIFWQTFLLHAGETIEQHMEQATKNSRLIELISLQQQ